jgi:UDP-N-acetylglucosamine enolpyruvyl transferase
MRVDPTGIDQFSVTFDMVIRCALPNICWRHAGALTATRAGFARRCVIGPRPIESALSRACARWARRSCWRTGWQGARKEAYRHEIYFDVVSVGANHQRHDGRRYG